MVHNKQWIWDTEPHVIDETWLSIETSGHRYLSYQKNLHIKTSTDKSVILLGWAWQTDEKQESPAEEIDVLSKTYSIDHLYDTECTWFGRYVVLFHNYVWMDTTGNLGCYYDGKRVSSSLVLLWKLRNSNEKLNEEDIPHVEIILGNADYTPGPLTPIKGIRRLLPSQMYDVNTSKTEYRQLIKHHFSKLTDEERLQQYKKNALYGIKQMGSTGLPLWCAITGGKDSRVAVALLEAANLDYNGYIIDFGMRSAADVPISKKIAKIIKKPWLKFVTQKIKQDSKRVLDWNRHCAYLSHEKAIYARHIDDSISDGRDIFSIRCSIFEVLEDIYTQEFTVDQYLETFSMRGKYFEESFKEWLDIVNKDNINGDIKILTRMYWEFRMGCWLSTNEQACDIMDNVTNIHIFNCRRNLELLWELNETTRHTRDWERTIVNELCPQLSKIPYDREYTNMRLKFYHAYVKLVGWLKIHIPISLYKRLKFIMNHIINTKWIN